MSLLILFFASFVSCTPTSPDALKTNVMLERLFQVLLFLIRYQYNVTLQLQFSTLPIPDYFARVVYTAPLDLETVRDLPGVRHEEVRDEFGQCPLRDITAEGEYCLWRRVEVTKEGHITILFFRIPMSRI